MSDLSDPELASVVMAKPNGATILAARPTNREREFLVLADRGAGVPDRFVVARMWSDRLTSWAWGDYSEDLHDALADYDRRRPPVARG